MIVTTETRIGKKGEVFDYLEEFSSFYNKIYRFTLEALWPEYFEKFYGSLNELTKSLQRRYGILSRTANSIVRLCKGRIETAREQREFLLSQAQSKRKAVRKKRKRLKETGAKLREKARRNELNKEELEKYRSVKKELHRLKEKEEELSGLIRKYKNELKTGVFPFVQGGKKFFNKRHHLKVSGYQNHQKWLRDYREKRDSNIEYTGRGAERCGNQICQFIPQEDGTFRLELLKEYAFRGDGMKAVQNGLKLSYLKEEYLTALEKGKPIYARFHKRGNRGWYLQLSFDVEERDILTDIKAGAVGIDFNSGHLSLVEVNSRGSFIGKENIILLEHAKGKRGLHEIRNVAKRIAERCALLKKPVVIENLSFIKKKRKNYGREKNRMLHSLDTARFKESLSRAAARHGVEVITVNPAYSSVIGKKKYLKEKMFETVHETAAFVIARRGMGISEEMFGY